MAGDLDPRRNRGTGDPLLAKTLYASDGRGAVAIAGLDLIGIPREAADAAIGEAARQTGLAPEAILISCSHTHSGPYTTHLLQRNDTIDADYVASLPGSIAASIKQAAEAARPATMHLGRSLVHHGLHHRRVIVKHDGKAINTWMRGLLDDLNATPQVLGCAGPIDPELWVARFDDSTGRVLGMLVNFSLHVNSRFGDTWSADYPGVIAEHMRAEFGAQAVSVFTPGACANVNPTLNGERWREGAELIAQQAVDAARRAVAVEDPVAVNAARREVTTGRRSPDEQRDDAIERLNWDGRGGRKDVFGPAAERVALLPEKLKIPVNAARIGPLGIASNPGELFVEWGLEIKRRSPFPHTIVTELTNDAIGYLPDRKAFSGEGYETLVGPNRVSLEGIEQLVDGAVELLTDLSGTEKQGENILL